MFVLHLCDIWIFFPPIKLLFREIFLKSWDKWERYCHIFIVFLQPSFIVFYYPQHGTMVVKKKKKIINM